MRDATLKKHSILFGYWYINKFSVLICQYREKVFLFTNKNPTALSIIEPGPINQMKQYSRLTIFFLILIPLAGTFWILSEIDPAGNYPNSRQGPGLTIDESFNVEQGYLLYEAMSIYGFALMDPASGKQIFSLPGYLPDHPPLGRLAIGMSHHFASKGETVKPENPEAITVSIVAGRWSSAFVFGIQLLLIGLVANRWYGPVAGISSMLALLFMPRVFGHAHIASLETMMNLTYSATVLSIASSWKPEEKISWKQILIPGVLLALALLTKIQGVLIPIPVGIWAFYYWRKKAFQPVILWGLLGVFVFFLLWPWLWLDPIEHFKEYLGRTTDRVHLKNWYWGQVWNDTDVPFHYSFIMFLVTIPVGLIGLGITSLFWKKQNVIQDPKKLLLVLCAFFPFVIFAKKGTAVYDGVRLFLVAYPLWAVLAGEGASRIYSVLETRFSKMISTGIITIFLLSQSVGNFSMSPCYLSYYNLLVGGLSGAEKFGFEVTYWGDSLTKDFLEEVVEAVPENSEISCFPVLHMKQLPALENQSPILAEKGIKLVAYDERIKKEKEYLLVFHKKADTEESLAAKLESAKLIREFRKQDVWLAALYELAKEN